MSKVEIVKLQDGGNKPETTKRGHRYELGKVKVKVKIRDRRRDEARKIVGFRAIQA